MRAWQQEADKSSVANGRGFEDRLKNRGSSSGGMDDGSRLATRCDYF